MEFVVNGPLKVLIPADAEGAFGFTGTIFSIAVERMIAGSAGSTIIDILKNGASILTAPVTFAFGEGDEVVKLATVSDSSFSTSDRFRMDMIAVETGARRIRARINTTRTGP